VNRWWIRFGYDGAAFAGWARQLGLRTVEGEIRRGLTRSGICREADRARLEVASRTDRGVSARANVLALDSDLGGVTLLRALNGLSSEIFFSAAAPAPQDLRVRGAVRRTYRYFDPVPVRHPARRREAARLFSGTVDVRSFGRGIPGSAPVRRIVESVSSSALDDGSLLEVRAPSFVWGMVRKIVAALREVDAGRLSVAQLASGIEGRSRLALPLAEPEPLVLWDVEYPLRWEFEWAGPNRHQSRYLEVARNQWRARRQVLAALTL
jgi:tRNA pseudouridine38-40 synthase